MADNDILLLIQQKVEKISDDVGDIKVTQARHDEVLKDHIRRTELLEESNTLFQEELKPIKIHISQIDGIFKYIGVLSGIVTFILGLLKLFKKI